MRSVLRQKLCASPLLPIVAVLFLIFGTTAQADFAAGWRAYQQGNFASALQHWTASAEAGDQVAQYNVGVMYDEATGVKRDPVKVAAWWNKAANQGHRAAQHNLALLLLESGSGPEARQAALWLQRAAMSGFVPSQHTLAKLYANGLGVEKDAALALKYFLKAGNAGFVKAQYNLGKIYRDGIGVEADAVVSMDWFRQAAEQGYAKAQEKLALRFADTSTTKHDAAEALKWAILAHQRGRASAEDLRDELRETMSPRQIAEAQRRAKTFQAVPTNNQ